MYGGNTVTTIPRWAKRIFKRRCISVGSGKGGPGKTTIAANLAAYLAEHGLKIGLVDADIHTPNVDCFFGIEGERMDVNEDMLIVPKEPVRGLYVMSVGNIIPSGVPILWSEEKVRDFLIKAFTSVDWPKKLDLYIVDLPPASVIELRTLNANFRKRHSTVLVTTGHKASVADCKRMAGLCLTEGVKISAIVDNMHGRFGSRGEKNVESLLKEAGNPPLIRVPDDPGMCVDGCYLYKKYEHKFLKLAEAVGVVF